MIGTGIEAYFNIGEATQVAAKEYYVGRLLPEQSYQDLLNVFNLNLPAGVMPVLSFSVLDSTTNKYITQKFLAPIYSGQNYAPLGATLSEKLLIWIDSIYPNEQTLLAAFESVDAVVFPTFEIASLDNLLEHLNTSGPYDLTNPASIYYFQFTVAGVKYAYVISEDFVRGEYGQFKLQFQEGDLVQFYSGSAGAAQSQLDNKVDKVANPEFESLDDTTDIYGITMFSRLGKIFRSPNIFWNEFLKKLVIKGTQAIWEAYEGVTDGNMGIKALENALVSWRLFDLGGNFISTGVENGKRLTRVFTAFRLNNGTAYNEAEFKSIDVAVSETKLIKAITIPNNSMLTVDVYNIGVFNADKKSLVGYAQFSFVNNAGVVSDISVDALRYNNQYSYLKVAPGAVTNVDARMDAAINGTTAEIKFINTLAKLTTVHCEIKYNITQIPEE